MTSFRKAHQLRIGWRVRGSDVGYLHGVGLALPMSLLVMIVLRSCIGIRHSGRVRLQGPPPLYRHRGNTGHHGSLRSAVVVHLVLRVRSRMYR